MTDPTRTAPPIDASTVPQTAVQTTPPLDPSAGPTLTYPGPPAAAASDQPVPGYEILGELGRGGMGVVYKARETSLNRTVALKMIVSGGHAGERELIRFLAEAEAVAAVRHPHVVQVYAYGPHAGRPFMALEYLPGGTLADRLKAGPLPPRAAAEVVAKVARGVAAAHDAGIVHRDIKPGNILFDEAGEPKVADFGLAKRAASDLTASQAFLGTPAYMAPEQAGGRAKFVGPPADVWALGVVLYECLTGTRPFADDDTMSLLRKVAEDDPESVRRRVPAVPRDIERVCLKCLSKDPADRYPTGKELADDLARFAAGEPVSVRRAGAAERAYKWARRKPTLAAAVLFGALAAGLAVFGGTVAALAVREKAARQEAEQQRQVAEESRSEAEAARDQEQAANDTLARSDYARTVALAFTQFHGGQPAVAGQLLEGLRPDLRGWEWDYLRGLTRRETLTLRGHQGGVYSVQFRPGGKQIATAGQDGTVRLWDAATGAAVGEPLKASDAPLYALAFDPKRPRLATAGQDGFVRVWDLSERRLIHSLGRPKAGQAAAVAYSPDGSRLAAGHEDGVLTIWDADTGAEVKAVPAHGKTVSAVAFSLDGSLFATGSFDKTIRLWDTATGSAVGKPLTGHAAEVTAVTFHPSRQSAALRLVSGSEDGSLREWDARTGSPKSISRQTERDLPVPVSEVTHSPDGAWVAAGRLDGAAVLRGPREQVIVVRAHIGRVHSVALSPDGKRLATAGDDGLAKAWDKYPTLPPWHVVGSAADLAAVTFTPDGRRMVAATGEGKRFEWDASPGPRPIPAPEMPRPEQKAFADPRGIGDWWSVALLQQPPAPTAQPPPLRPSAGSAALGPLGPGGRWVVVHEDGRLQIRFPDRPEPRPLDWPRATRSASPVQMQRAGGRAAVAASPDGALLVAGRGDGAVGVWDAATWKPRLAFDAHDGPVLAAAVSPDGKAIATAGTDRTARLWDAATGKPGPVLRGHLAEVVCVAFAPDGTWLATGGADNAVRIWDAATGAERAVLRGHAGAVAALAVSPDGRRLATGGTDRTVRLWDAARGQELLAWELGSVRALAFSPDGDKLAAVGDWPGVRLITRTPPDLPLFPPDPPAPGPR